MKKYTFLLLSLLIAGVLYAQILKPIKWNSLSEPTPVQVGDEVELIFRASIDMGWYLYSSDFDPNLGPMVTTFKFEKNNTFELIGDIKPTKPKKKYDELWGGEYTYFTGKAEFRQKVKILKENPIIKVLAEYQVCSDTDGKCIPLEEDFSFPIQVEGKKKSGEEVIIPVSKPDSNAHNPIQDTTISSLSSENTLSTQKKDSLYAASNAALLSNSSEESLWGFMLLAFLGGLTALLTPCVFPMIPMTVSYFTSNEGERSKSIFHALLYGASIVVIYTLLGVVVSKLMGADAANIISTHWLPNSIFFIVFVVFAISFFGAFEIVLPSNFVNSIDKQADKGGLVGVFFMALTLVVVSFSCTGPIAGTILVESARGNVIKPVLGMFAFSMAFALPFTLFAIFPSWLSRLPKSGGWLNTVKVVLGFIELALALKFLSVIDQVYHWSILDREIYIALWIGIAFCMGLYLLGNFRLSHDSPVEKIGVIRLLLAITSFSFIIYLFPGMFGAPLGALSGYLPPITTHDFDISTVARQKGVSTKAKYSDFLHLPHGLQGYFDYKEGLEAAKKLNKPVFIDFTGHGCVNCREMEARVWIASPVLERLKNDFVVIALYVDDPTELPENEWITTPDAKTKKTIGKINSYIQQSRFNNNAQPYYLLLDTEGNLLVKPKGYDLNVDNFIKFLDEGKMAFKKRQ